MKNAIPTETKAGRRGRRVRRARTALVVLLLLWVAGAAALRLVPLPQALFEPPVPGVELLDRHGRPLRALLGAEGGFSRPARFDEIPQSLIDATLAAEDRRFFNHGGVDGWAILRAAADAARYGRAVSGASTITQQLIKHAQRRPRNLRTKLVEAVQALRLEQVWDKRQILTEYLNRVDYGNLTTGCAEAARFYFDKPLGDLSPAEAALLAGLPQSPSRLNPRGHPERARKRQQWILHRMEATGRLSASEAARARREPLRLAASGRAFHAPHFVDHLLASSNIAGLRGRVRTTLDLDLNRFAAGALSQQLGKLHERGASDGAVVVLDNRSGDVLALVGSADYFDPRDGQVNGALAARSAGSTLKPFTYLLALERGASPATVIADLPAEFPTPTGLYRPENYDRRFHGPVRLRQALANSYNVPAVRMLDDLGGPAALQARLETFGITTLNRGAAQYGLGLTLGNAGVRLIELAGAYATLARLGETMDVRLRPDSGARAEFLSGSQPRAERQRGTRVADPAAAWLIADMLADPAARSMAFGMDSDLRLPFPAAVKTGTSSEFRDNWAVGFTPEFTVGVWVGNFDGTPMNAVSGVSGAAPVWRQVFAELHSRHGTTWYQRPPQVIEVVVHPLTGRQVPRDTPGGILEYCLADAPPTPAQRNDIDELGRVRLPTEYATWLAGPDSWLAGRAVAAASPEFERTFRLLSPLPGTVYFIDPDLPGSGRWIPLRADAAAPKDLIWQSATLECRSSPTGPVAVMQPGRHRLVASSPTSGRRIETWVEVKRL